MLRQIAFPLGLLHPFHGWLQTEACIQSPARFDLFCQLLVCRIPRLTSPIALLVSVPQTTCPIPQSEMNTFLWLTPLCRLGSNPHYPNASWPLRRPLMRSL